MASVLPRNGKWRILVLVLLTLAVSLAAFVRFHRVHALSEKDTIVLADFTNTTGDVIFDGALREGLAVELEQSPFLNLVPDTQIQQTLHMMKQPPDIRLTPELAVEICHRTNGTAVLQSSISQIGTQYQMVLKVVNCSTGESIASTQAQAGDKDHILSALRRASSDLRKRLGESLATLQKFDAPLIQATTPSLPALKAYSLGVSKFAKGDQAGAVPLFQQAIELDSDFAMAYANLGRSYNVLGQYQLSEDSVRKAFALRDRASERERFDITAVYHQFVSFRVDLAIQDCELWEQSYPRDFTPHRILGAENAVLGRYERSAGEFRKAMEVDPTQALPYAGLMRDYMALNRLPEVRIVYQQAQARSVEAGEVRRVRYLLAFLEADSEAMASLAASLSKEPGYEYRVLWDESAAAAYFGNLKKARELARRSVDMVLEKKDTGTAARMEADQAIREMLFGNLSEARRHVAAAQKLGGDPAFYSLAVALARGPAQATKVVDAVAKQAPSESFLDKEVIPEFRGAIELHRGNAEQALQFLARSSSHESGWLDLYMAAYLRGEAYLIAHRGREAETEFQKIIDHRGVVGTLPIGALAHLGLARAYKLQNDTLNTRTAYQEFLTLWKDADPDIPILVSAKSEYNKLQ
jgi:tetratricopeptide (TPR) repeat protein